MGEPLAIISLALAGIAGVGLVGDVWAMRQPHTRVFGISALAIKGVLLLALVAEIIHLRGLPHDLHAYLSQSLSVLVLFSAGVPLTVIAIGCETCVLSRARKDARATRR